MARTILLSASYPLSALGGGRRWSGCGSRDEDASYARNVRREKKRVRDLKRLLRINPDEVL